jgi:hypothetical protein
MARSRIRARAGAIQQASPDILGGSSVGADCSQFVGNSGGMASNGYQVEAGLTRQLLLRSDSDLAAS